MALAFFILFLTGAIMGHGQCRIQAFSERAQILSESNTNPARELRG